MPETVQHEIADTKTPCQIERQVLYFKTLNKENFYVLESLIVLVSWFLTRNPTLLFCNGPHK